ncbi:MAG: SIS domain-containing protein [Candidatus Hydrogenedentes bacterium]|nr:SIS domain-containing protein [Candidatus Hydrogenedentota bacterium]
MNTLEKLFEESASPAEYVEAYTTHMASLMQSLDAESVAQVMRAIGAAAEHDQTVFLMGNGGSGAVGAHWVNDLGANSVVEGMPGFRVISLTDNPFSVTAVANDVSFEEIFVIQLKASMRPGDLVIAMSVSGNSPNVVRGAQYANDHGATTIGCTGFDGGKLRDLCRYGVHVPSSKDEYGPVEDMFSVVMHLVTSYITMERGRLLRH